MATLGTTRTGRGLPALRPGWLKVDSRSPRQLLAGTQATARLFRYFNATNEPEGQWDRFFEKEPLIQYAHFAEIDLRSIGQSLRLLLSGLGGAIDPQNPGHQAAAWAVIEQLTALFRRVDRASIVFTDLPNETDFSGMLAQAIHGPLVSSRSQVMLCRAWLLLHRCDPFDEAGWPGSWPASHYDVYSEHWQPLPPLGDPSGLTPAGFVDALTDGTERTYSTLQQLVESAGSWYETRSTSPTGLQPHFGLYLAFLGGFSRAQAVLNRVPDRHCDFFYSTVLKLKRRGPVPDTVFVAFTPTAGSSADLAPGTLVNAAKDSAGLAASYGLVEGVEVTPARIAQFSTVFLQPSSDGASGFYCASQANSADGVGKPLAPGDSWATFGENQASLAKTSRTMADAEVGFAVSSPVLHLESGSRNLRVTVVFADQTPAPAAGPSPVPCPLDGWVDYSGAQGWIVVPAQQVSGVLVYDNPASSGPLPITATFLITLNPGDPGCVNYDAKTLGPGFDSRVPVVRIHFSNPLTAFSANDSGVAQAFLRALARRIEIDIVVNGATADVLAGPTGTLPSGKPVPLFGSPVQPSASFLVGSVELFRKTPSSLSLSLGWVGLPDSPMGLQGYFKGYLIAFDATQAPTAFRNDQYLVQWSGLFGCQWSRIDKAKELLPGALDGEYLFVWPDPAAPPGAGAWKLGNASRWTATAYGLEAWKPSPGLAGPLVASGNPPTGFLQLLLVAPGYLFGQPVYATVVSDIALDNALAIAASVKPPAPPPPPSSYTMAAAYRILVVPPIPLTFFQRIGALVTLKGAPSATFKPSVLPAVTAAGGFSAEVKAFVLAAAADPDQVYANLVGLVTSPPVFTDLDSFVQAMGAAFSWSLPSRFEQVALEEVIGWMASLLYQPSPTPKPEIKPPPPPPLVPTATAVQFSYGAGTTIALDRIVDSEDPPWDRAWTLNPMTVSEIEGIAPLLPQIAEGGTLYLGIDAAAIPQVLTLLFVLEPVSVISFPSLQTDAPKWSLLSGDQWVAAADAVFSGTDGFLRSGIVRITLGESADTAHAVMQNGLVWLRGEVKSPALHLRTVQVCPNAGTAAWVASPGATPAEVAAHFSGPLPPGGLTALAVPDPGVAGVLQPLASFGGVLPENETQFRVRVGERLRHKGRPWARRDYERILLSRFPSVFYARATTGTLPTQGTLVTLVVIPTVIGIPDVLPGFTQSELGNMRDVLKAVCPVDCQLQVVNPLYDKVQISAGVRFKPDRSFEHYREALTADLAQYLSPWIYDQNRASEIGGSTSISELGAFIRKRAYVLALGLCTASILRADGVLLSVPGGILAPSGTKALLTGAESHHDFHPL